MTSQKAEGGMIQLQTLLCELGTHFTALRKTKTTIKKKQFTGLHFVLKLVGISYNTLLKIICYNKVKL